MQAAAETEEQPKPRKQLTQTKLQPLRRGFKTLQHEATDKENLAGRPTKLITSTKSKEAPVEQWTESDKKFVHVGIQTEVDIGFNIEELVSADEPSEGYWKIVAERRRVTLEEALEENQKLHEKLEKLEKETELLREMVDESKSIVDVLSDMISEQESGIDLAEASTSSVNEEDNSTEKN
ncbi:geminin DNA replication inhibitor [Arctopsyche grandis]|uniref:geminin DNA replication inhibitor n=1 Tax=Arctopsyche grandis TaxID=121162 RepID=UPI00406D9605